MLTFANCGSTYNCGVKIFKQSASNSLILTHSELGWCSFPGPYLKFRSWWQAGLFLTSKVAEKSHGNSLSKKDDKVGPCRLTSFCPAVLKHTFWPHQLPHLKKKQKLLFLFLSSKYSFLVLNHHRNYQSQVRIRCHTWHSGPLRFSNLPCLADFTWLAKLLHESKIFFLWKKWNCNHMAAALRSSHRDSSN